MRSTLLRQTGLSIVRRERGARLLLELRILGHDRRTFDAGLRDQHAVEWVGVMAVARPRVRHEAV